MHDKVEKVRNQRLQISFPGQYNIFYFFLFFVVVFHREEENMKKYSS